MGFTRTGIFVDAGYVFARGGAALTDGRDVSRARLRLDDVAVVKRLIAEADAYGGAGSLLRIYWYDASPARGLNTEHLRLAEANDVKVRLGILNDFGQQKGVDSLIITDLIELARNRAMTHAILIAGDEDLRVGVQVVQTFGIRVQLLGIVTPRGTAQSRDLRREADTVAAWDAATVRTFLAVDALPPALPETPAAGTPPARPAVAPPATPPQDEREYADPAGVAGEEPQPEIERTADTFARQLPRVDAATVSDNYLTTGKIPYHIDSRLLATVRTALGRDLTEPEKRGLRNLFVKALAERLAERAEGP